MRPREQDERAGDNWDICNPPRSAGIDEPLLEGVAMKTNVCAALARRWVASPLVSTSNIDAPRATMFTHRKSKAIAWNLNRQGCGQFNIET
jgi:hypothetical protein